jgi:hypothetical protein
MTALAPHIEAFLREHLTHHRGASQHTCDSYAYSFQLLFEFAARRFKAAPSALKLEQLDAELIGAFLKDLEEGRRNSPDTRNTRLAAIRSFFRFLEHREPAALEQIRRVLAIPFKRTNSRLAGDPRPGHAAPRHMQRSASIRTDRIMHYRYHPSREDHSRPGQRPERTDTAPLESDDYGAPSMVGGAWNSRGARVVCQRARPTPEPLGCRLYAATPRTERASKMSMVVHKTGITARTKTHLRHGRAPIHP